MYFCSLNGLKCESENVDCLFVHFPPLTVKNHEQNIAFVKDLIAELLEK